MTETALETTYRGERNKIKKHRRSVEEDESAVSGCGSDPPAPNERPQPTSLDPTPDASSPRVIRAQLPIQPSNLQQLGPLTSSA